jgi:hypothetical protein
MKTLFKKIIILTLFVFTSWISVAQWVDIDNIRYAIISSSSGQTCASVAGVVDNSISTITIPPTIPYNGMTLNVTSIAGFTFSNCQNLQQVNLPNTITEIGYAAFAGIYIQQINLPSSLVTLSSSVFLNCTQLQSITIPENVQTVGYSCFMGCTSLSSVEFAANSNTWRIDDYAFKGCTSLNSITFPTSVKAIGTEAFYGCSNLTSANFGDSLNNIGQRAFRDCSNITNVVFPDGLDTISAFAFANTGLTSVTIPTDTKYIGQQAFSNCPLLTSVVFNATECENFIGNGPFTDSPIANATISEGVKTIPGNFLFENTNINNISCPSTLISIGYNAFKGCNRLRDLILNNGLLGIGDNAFNGCIMLDTVTIPESLVSIGVNAFNECSSLSYLTLGDSLQTIAANAFSNCTSLPNITLPPFLLFIGSSAFSGCVQFTEIEIPDKVETLGSYAFKDCNHLEIVRFGDSTKTIDQRAFQNCVALHTVYLGCGLEMINGNAFTDCIALTDLYCMAEVPPAFGMGNVFPSSNNCTLTVPCGKKQAYSTGLWGAYFYPRIEEMSYFVDVTVNDTLYGYVNVATDCATNSAILMAVANDGYLFESWNDGNTDNPREISLTKDTAFVATFSAVGLEDVVSSEQIVVFPNPSNGLFTLELPQGVSNKYAIVSDIQGRVVKTFSIDKGQRNIKIDLQGCEQGIYFLNVDSNNIKIVVE